MRWLRQRVRTGVRLFIRDDKAATAVEFALLALPFFIFVVLNLINPTYMAPLYTTHQGELILFGGAIGLGIGALIMNRIAVLKS